MKRSLIFTAKVLLFLMGFTLSLYYFMDWGSIGKFALSTAHSRLESSGMRIGYSGVSGETNGFTVDNLTLNGTANVSFSSITIRPRLLSSVLSLGLVCDISFRGCSVRLGQSLNFGDGRLLLTTGRSEVLMENLMTNGDFMLDGYISIDTANMRIGRADAKIFVPEAFENNMGMLQNFLPLVQEGDRWYLRRR